MFSRINELAASGDHDFQHLADEIPSPENILNSEETDR